MSASAFASKPTLNPPIKEYSTMAHEVTLDIATKFVLHKDVKIEVKTDDGKLGTLLVSKGNIEWLPSGNSVNKKRLSWKRFAEVIEREGKSVRAKKKTEI